MSCRVRNFTDEERNYASIIKVDGHVLHLDPGEEADVAEDPGQVSNLLVQRNGKWEGPDDAPTEVVEDEPVVSEPPKVDLSTTITPPVIPPAPAGTTTP